MRIEIRSDSVLLDGYVNVTNRDSRPLITEHGKVVEQIEERAFDEALKRADDVSLLVDHDRERKIGSTKEGNLKLFEDNIGLRAICTVTDADVIQKAKKGLLKGWSFGMNVIKDAIEQRADALPRRIVKALDIFEVSIIDDKMNPCYSGTSIEQRASDGEDFVNEQRYNYNKIITESFEKKHDYSSYENRLKQIQK